MLAPVKVIDPRVMAEQYPEKEQQKHKKFAPRKPTPKKREIKFQDGDHIDMTA